MEMKRHALFRFGARVLVISVVVCSVSAVIWLFGRHTVERFGYVLFVVGAIVAIIGSFLGQGARQGSVDPAYFHSKSIGDADFDERIREESEYQERSEYTGMVLAVAGGIAIGTACLLLWLS